MGTDKSGRFAVMSREGYLLAGEVHTRKDEEVGWKEIKDTQAKLNGHVSMIMKIFRGGKAWGHEDRIRSNMLNKSFAICPMYLSYKDHKNWSASEGGPPPPQYTYVGGYGWV